MRSLNPANGCFEFYYNLVDFQNTDDDNATIYYRTTQNGLTSEWSVFPGYTLLFECSRDFEIEAYAQAEGKLPSEICHEYNDFPSNFFLVATVYYIDGLYYVAHDDLIGRKDVMFASDHPYIGGVFNDWGYDLQPSGYSGEIVIPDQICWGNTYYNVTTIDRGAFMQSDVTSVVIPNSITKIECEAFEDCSHLTGIEIPKNVTSIGDNAFSGCSGLTSITVDSENNTFDSRDNCNAIILTGANMLVQGCQNTIIPNTVTGIYDFAFMGCSSLNHIEIPNSVSQIGYNAFDGCNGLTSINIQAITPPTAFFVFDDMSDLYELVTLFVPNESLESYCSHEEWSRFTHIVPFIGAGPGDINGDGNIAVSDVTNLIDQLLGGDELPAYADVNGDGVVTIKDVTDLIDMLLNGN